MKAGSGAHEALAGTHGGELDEELEGDDPKLGAMRAVWLSMRDEDPPAGGLAELLAAARVKAGAMRLRPPLWERLWAALWRPPVLAFAMVIVLIGGAIVVERRADVAAVPERVLARQAAQSPGARAGAEVGRVQDPPTPAAVPMPATPEPVSSPASSPPGAGAADAATAAPAKKPRALATGTDGRGGKPLDIAKRRALAAMLDRMATEAPAPGTDDTVGVLSSTTGLAAQADVLAAKPKEAGMANVPARPGAGAARADESAEAAPEAPSAAESAAEREPDRADAAQQPSLMQQCQAAAERGDCASVRRLVERITTTDRGFRARIAKGSRIAKCLAE